MSSAVTVTILCSMCSSVSVNGILVQKWMPSSLVDECLFSGTCISSGIVIGFDHEYLMQIRSIFLLFMMLSLVNESWHSYKT